MIGFEAGGMIYSNVRNKNVNSRLEIDHQEFNSIFKNWRGFITPHVLVSFKIKDVYLNVGAGYSRLSYIKSDFFQNTEKNTVYGLELKASVTYRF